MIGCIQENIEIVMDVMYLSRLDLCPKRKTIVLTSVVLFTIFRLHGSRSIIRRHVTCERA